MTFKELASMRYSLRSYTNEPVSEKELEYLMECARLAPSAVNFQPWRFYIATTDEAKNKLRQCYAREWFTTAPCYIVCTLCHEEEWVRKTDDKPHGQIDVAIAAEHICLAAAELGLGTCWVCNFDTIKCSELLELPANEEPVVLIPVGHATPAVEVQPKKRKDLDEIVSQI